MRFLLFLSLLIVYYVGVSNSLLALTPTSSTTAVLQGPRRRASNSSPLLNWVRKHHLAPKPHSGNFALSMASSDDENHDKEEEGDDDDDDSMRKTSSRSDNTILSRFTSPVIDDPGLPLSDCLVAQVIAPSLQIAYLSLRHAPPPTWLIQPVQTSASNTGLLYYNSNRPGAFVAPTLIHGAALASCWVVGALAARAYERRSISPVKRKESNYNVNDNNGDDNVNDGGSSWDYGNVLGAIFRGGAFASGLLILATQGDLFLEFGRYVQLGESDQVDFRLLVAAVELVNDIVFEAATISIWRLYLAYQTERMAATNSE